MSHHLPLGGGKVTPFTAVVRVGPLEIWDTIRPGVGPELDPGPRTFRNK